MRIVHAATVVRPRAEHLSAERNWSIVFDQERVLEAGPAADFEERVRRGAFEDVIGGSRLLVVPGLVNTHHHLYQCLTRCLPNVQNDRLFDWLRKLYTHWRELDYRSLRLAAKISIAELLLHGCTTTSDHFYMFPRASDVRIEAVLEAAEELGIRLHLCRGSMSLGKSHGGLPPDDCVERDEDILSDCVRALDAWHDSRPYALRRIDLAPCSPFNVTPELLRDTRVLARERGVLLHTHVAETLDEQAFCLARFRRRPLRYLADLEWLGPDVYLAHCVWLDDDEISLLARTGTGVSLCPVSNMRLGSGWPRINELMAAGVRLGVGVDGSSSNDGGNLLAATKLTLLAGRAQQASSGSGAGAGRGIEDLLPAAACLQMATVGGAACLARPELGHLEPGAAADFALFRMDDPALAGAVMHDPVAALVLCDAPRAERVFVAGREVVREGRVVSLDAEALGREFNELVAGRFVK